VASMLKKSSRVAAIYDIHGNLPALEAVLSDLEHIEPDLLIVGGDVVSGTMPAEVLDWLVSLGKAYASCAATRIGKSFPLQR
jgi:Icc-related predicted phosphoesterase